MLLINAYGRINSPLIISKKLGVGISNPPKNWIIGLQDDLREEMLLRDHDLEVWNKIGIKNIGVSSYNLCDLVKAAKWEKNSSQSAYIIAEDYYRKYEDDFGKTPARVAHAIRTLLRISLDSIYINE